jgi:hypothetical protein
LGGIIRIVHLIRVVVFQRSKPIRGAENMWRMTTVLSHEWIRNDALDVFLSHPLRPLDPRRGVSEKQNQHADLKPLC